mmetsp:Transcript_1475/g.4732  ORF Transcript_1475/g.4732 Transcript_1475/m.4732 type:complete len:367 (+) Transcript_1475:614-1714(+)
MLLQPFEVGQAVHHGWHECCEEARLGPELLPRVAYAATQHAPQHVAAALVGRNGTVCDGDDERAHVVGDDTVGHVAQSHVLLPQLARVRRRARLGLDGRKDGTKYVRVVVGAHVLQHRHQPLEAHAGVDVLGGQRPERAAQLAVELHEDQVPDLEHVRVVLVDQVRRVTAADAVKVQLRAGAARPRVTHLPEVVLDIEGHHAIGWEVLQPDLARLVVTRDTQCLVASEIRSVEAVLWDAADVGEQLPGPGDGLLLEVVTKGPVAAHLEEGVVVDVLADVVEIVVFAAGPDALLSVGGALELRQARVGVGLPEENGLELVHPRVDEEERRVVVGHHGRRSPERVLRLGGEEVDVGVPHVRDRLEHCL